MELKEKAMFQRMMSSLLGAKQQLAGDRVLRASVALVAFIAVPVLSAGLNGTGIDFCSNDTSNYVACASVAGDNGSNPRQNGRLGRDAQASAGQLTKIGGGDAGFDYSKIADNGRVLNANAPNWPCTRDNVTGLIWEVKTLSGLHSQYDTYNWYSSDSTSNGGATGIASLGSCYTGGCDTEKFVAAVNFAGLCGANDWRMPTVKELQGVADYGMGTPAIDPDYFPNTPTTKPFWTSTASTDDVYHAWTVDFLDGRARTYGRYLPVYVRLVRGGS